MDPKEAQLFGRAVPESCAQPSSEITLLLFLRLEGGDSMLDCISKAFEAAKKLYSVEKPKWEFSAHSEAPNPFLKPSKRFLSSLTPTI